MNYINKHKFGQSVRFIYENIDKPIKLEEIASNIGMSLSSLKRLFEETVNLTPGTFIRRLRMELAFRSLKSRNDSILEVALASGFDDQSAFARRFKETFGYSPKKAREKFNIVNELECISLEEPDIVELKTLQLQSVTKVGLYFEAAPKAWEALKNQLNAFELSDDFSGLFQLAYVALKTMDSTIEVEAQLRALCTQNLASYKIPRYFTCLQDLPMSATGKIDKKQLISMYR